MSDDDEEMYSIGLELGSHTLRIGICGEEGPRQQFANCFGTDGENTLIGKDDFETRIDYKLTYPFHRGLLKNETDWDKVEKILDYALKNEKSGVYDYLIVDRFFDGNELNKIFKASTVICTYSSGVSEEPEELKKLHQIRTYPYIPINKKYNIILQSL